MSKQIEELSRNLAGGMSRRRAFWRFFAGMGGAVFAGKAFGRNGGGSNGNDVCVEFCRYQGLSDAEFGRCVSESAKCPPGECAMMANGANFICVPVCPE